MLSKLFKQRLKLEGSDSPWISPFSTLTRAFSNKEAQTFSSPANSAVSEEMKEAEEEHGAVVEDMLRRASTFNENAIPIPRKTGDTHDSDELSWGHKGDKQAGQQQQERASKKQHGTGRKEDDVGDRPLSKNYQSKVKAALDRQKVEDEIMEERLKKPSDFGGVAS